MILFGDLSLAVILGERRGFTAVRSDQRFMELDQIGWMLSERIDIVCANLGDNSVAGPIVGLVGG